VCRLILRTEKIRKDVRRIFSVTRKADMLVFFPEYYIDILSGGETQLESSYGP
jgi:hypothetical protein